MKQLAAALLMLLPAPALAQAYQCSLPQRIQLPDPPRPDGPARRMAITGYTLAASWSPHYCRTARDGQSMQCSGRNGLFGFVLHGLWPEGRSGWPQWCNGKSVEEIKKVYMIGPEWTEEKKEQQPK